MPGREKGAAEMGKDSAPKQALLSPLSLSDASNESRVEADEKSAGYGNEEEGTSPVVRTEITRVLE